MCGATRGSREGRVHGSFDKTVSAPVSPLFPLHVSPISFLHRAESDRAKVEHGNLDYNIIRNGYTRRQIADVRTRYRTTYTRWLGQNELVCQYEEDHGIQARWTPSMPEYKDALVILSQRTYRRALDELERLFVQRLLELTKLGMNGVGMSFNKLILFRVPQYIFVRI